MGNRNMGNRSTTFFIIFLTVIALLMGYNYFFQPFTPTQSSDLGQSEVDSQDEKVGEYVEQKVKLFESLPPQEKISQLIAYPLEIEEIAGSEVQSADEQQEQRVGSDDEVEILGQAVSKSELSNRKKISQMVAFNPGMVIVFGDKISFDQLNDLTVSSQQLLQNETLKPLWSVDHEGGHVQRLSGKGFTALPSMKQLCQLEVDEQRELLKSSAEELAEAGVTVVFGPVVDLNATPLRDRSCSSLDELISATEIFIEEFGDSGIMPVIKHFPGLGNTTRDLHYGAESIILSQDDTLIFSTLLRQYPNIGVMTTHVQLKDMLDGMPCSLSSECLKSFASDFPSALVFIDGLEMAALETIADQLVKEQDFDSQNETSSTNSVYKTEATRLAALAYQALMAGNEILIFGKSVTHEQLLEVRQILGGRYSQDDELKNKVDRAVAKVLASKEIRPLENTNGDNYE